MPTFGLDVSRHQPMLNYTQAKREGIEFVVIKATEGASWVDPKFDDNLIAVRAAKILPAAYHYQRSDASAAAQVANIQRVVPKDVPVIPDVEANSGSVGLTRDIVGRLRDAGYRVPMAYIPRWYWQQIGSPSLAGLPPLWSSRYPDNVPGPLLDEYEDVPSSYWAGYGGLAVAMLQFSSSGRVAGYQPLDLNAYPGTVAGLRALFYGEQPTEGKMRNLIIAHKTGETELWVGDGTIRRSVDPAKVGGLQFWIKQYGGNDTIQVVDELDLVLGPVAKDPATPAPVDIDYARLVEDVTDRLAIKLRAELRFVPMPPE